MTGPQKFIQSKVEVMKKSLVDGEQNPVFVLAVKAKITGPNTANVELIPYFFPDTDKGMEKKDKLLILDFLAEFSKKEKKTL